MTIKRLSKYILEMQKAYNNKYLVSLIYNIKTGEMITLSVNNINFLNKYQLQATPIKTLDTLSVYRDKMLKEVHELKTICGY